MKAAALPFNTCTPAAALVPLGEWSLVDMHDGGISQTTMMMTTIVGETLELHYWTHFIADAQFGKYWR